MKRHNASSVVSNGTDKPGETISHGDGALELELPADGSTLESAPDGGLRAWLIVLACAGINALFSLMQILIRISLLHQDMSTDTGIDSGTLVEIDLQLIALSNLYAPLAAIVMIFLGYRVTICIGSTVVMTTLIILSYLGDDDTEHFIKFLLYGPTAVGISFIQLGALIPVLEYFTTKRMKALFLSRLGSFVGQLILLVIVLSTPSLAIKWREFFRGCSGLCIGIGIFGFTLKELKLKMKNDESVTFVQKTIGLAKEAILKSVLFWLTCVVYFFYQWGIETPQAQFADPDATTQLGFSDSIAKAVIYGLSSTFGLALGMFLAWMFKKAAYDEQSRFHVQKLKAYGHMNIIFGILVVAAATMGVGCFIAPHAANFGYFFLFRLLFATLFTFCEGLRDDAIPDEFGRENVRIVEGLILMFAGLGEVITNAIGEGIADDKEDDWKKLFRYGGGMLLLSSIVTAVVLFLKQRNILDDIQTKIDAHIVKPINSNDTPLKSKPGQNKQSRDLINNQNGSSSKQENDDSQRKGKGGSSSKQQNDDFQRKGKGSSKQENDFTQRKGKDGSSSKQENDVTQSKGKGGSSSKQEDDVTQRKGKDGSSSKQENDVTQRKGKDGSSSKQENDDTQRNSKVGSSSKQENDDTQRNSKVGSSSKQENDGDNDDTLPDQLLEVLTDGALFEEISSNF